MKLPGDRGKATPWCSAAGKFEADNEQYMAGMALCAAKPNSLSQFVIEISGEWLELLRVQRQVGWAAPTQSGRPLMVILTRHRPRYGRAKLLLSRFDWHGSAGASPSRLTAPSIRRR